MCSFVQRGYQKLTLIQMAFELIELTLLQSNGESDFVVGGRIVEPGPLARHRVRVFDGIVRARSRVCSNEQGEGR